MPHVLLACGWAALGLGVVGIAVPVLPTVPFLLLAAACFLRGSERSHRWLVSHPVFGPPIADYVAGRGVRPRAKALALATLWVGVLVSVVVFVPLPEVDVLLLAIAGAVSVYLLRLPGPASGSSASEAEGGAAPAEVPPHDQEQGARSGPTGAPRPPS